MQRRSLATRRPSILPRVGAVAATIAVALTTAFMQPMHAATYPLEPQATTTAAASPGTPDPFCADLRLGELPAMLVDVLVGH